MPANQHHALVPLHGHGPFLQWQASRASVGAGHARERTNNQACAYSRTCLLPVLLIRVGVRLRALHHRRSDSIMPSFAIDGFSEFLCSLP